MLTGRKPLYIVGFRPVNLGVLEKRDGGVEFPAEP